MARVTLLKLWFTRWTVWEYMPWWIANVPVYGFWLWHSLRSRHFFFFSNVNPSIPLGGAMGESKSEILKLLPQEVVPKWAYVATGASANEVIASLERAGINFPLVAKPDVGERGFLVKKIDSLDMLLRYLQQWPTPFILQEFLTQPQEASVLFHRFPGEPGRFAITSICLKEFLRVRGDGVSSIRVLMELDTRSAFQIGRFERDFSELMEKVPAVGEEILLEPIGNHARGTKFLNGNNLIDAQLQSAFEAVCRNIEGVHYGRFDLKFQDAAALRRGEFKTMELNGVFGEPAHIYDPNYGTWCAYRDIWRHWEVLFQLHKAQKDRGIQPTSSAEGCRFIWSYFRYKRTLESRLPG